MSMFVQTLDVLTPAERKSASALLGLMLVGMFLEMLGIGLVMPVITLLMHGDAANRLPYFDPLISALEGLSQAELVIGAMTGLACVYVLKNLFLAYLAWRKARFAFSVQAELSQRLFSTYLRQPYTFHLQRNSAHLIRNVTTEVNLFSTHALIPGMLLMTEGLVMVGVGGLLLYFEPLGTLVVALVVGGCAWGFFQLTRTRVNHWGRERQFHDGQRIKHLQQGLGGVKEVLLLGRASTFLSRYGTHNLGSARAAELQVALQQLPRLGLETLAVIGLAMLAVVMTLSGKDMENIVPALGLFAAAAFRLMPSVNRMLGSIQTLRFMSPVIETLHEELRYVPIVPAEQAGPGPSRLQHQIELIDIEFSYPDTSAPALQGVAITISKGECIGFVGASGSGKSTLIDVVLGLLHPDKGGVRVDGRDITEDLRAWQAQIGYVPQTIYLTDDTITRNVAFGLPDDEIDIAAVKNAICLAQLDRFVAGLTDGLETLVGERGIRLSGGQRQRIGIARAIYHDPSVLVLDEATSALDAETERGVMEAVSSLHGVKTILVVAHRHSTVRHCDRIYRIEHGRAVEAGSIP